MYSFFIPQTIACHRYGTIRTVRAPFASRASPGSLGVLSQLCPRSRKQYKVTSAVSRESSTFCAAPSVCSISLSQAVERSTVLDLLSSILGSIIIVGSFVLKIPQIARILSNRSVKGLSRTAIEIESFCYTVQLAYFLRAPVKLHF